MSIKPKERYLLLAGVLALAAAAMIYSLESGRQTSPASTDVGIVMAAVDIPVGAPLTADQLKISSFPKNLVPADSVRSASSVVGMRAKVSIKAGQTISTKSLRPAGIQLSDNIPPGMRAVTVGLDPVIGVGGFLKPRDRVDVVATFEVNGKSYARTVLQSVTLLAIGAESGEGSNVSPDKNTSKNAPTATLAVTPSDAERLILADAKGKLRLALRSTQDKSVASRKPVSAQAVMGVAEQQETTAGPRQPINLGPPPRPVIPGQDGTTIEQMLLRQKLLGATQPQGPAGKTIVEVRGTKVDEVVFPK